MSKYRVFGILSASVILGDYEASSVEEAERMAMDDDMANHHPSICHQCSRGVELGDIYKMETEEI